MLMAEEELTLKGKNPIIYKKGTFLGCCLGCLMFVESVYIYVKIDENLRC